MKIDENELYRNVTSRICGSLDFNDALNKTDLYLKTIFPHEQMTILVLREDFKTLEILATTVNDMVLDSSAMIPLTDNSRRVLLKGVFGSSDKHDIVRLKNHGADDSIHQDTISALSTNIAFSKLYTNAVLSSMNKQSLMVLKLNISDTTLGYVSMNAEGYNVFSEENARQLKGLAEPFAIALSNYLRHREIVRLKDILDDNQKNLQKDLIRISGDKVIGSENGLSQVMELARMVAGMDSPVLILGETGVGKEVVANAIHQISERRDGPMISVNCGAIPETLADSELFGHEKGAFTGAVSQKRGYFERAHGGTIFLDEIGELSPSSQVKLLRFIQTMTFDRVGGTRPVNVDVRIIAATHRDLEAMIKDGAFRQDLWFRLNVFPINIPPLRDRKQDIPALVEYLISKKSQELNLLPRPVLAKGAIEALVKYNWPGNVRELQNIVERALIINRGRPVLFSIPGEIQPLPNQPIPVAAAAPKPSTRFEDIIPLNLTIKHAIEHALKTTHGRIEGPFGAATLLELPPSTLKNKMKKLGVVRLSTPYS